MRAWLLAAAVLVSACSAAGPQDQTTAVATLASATPSPQPTPSPSPTLPPADKLLGDSYTAMQRITSVKTTTSLKGTRRSYDATLGLRSAESAVTGAAVFQASADRKTDAYQSDLTQISDPPRSQTIVIGTELFSKLDRLPDPAHGLAGGSYPWSGPVLQRQPYLFPSETFGQFDGFPSSDPAVKQAPPTTEGIVQRGATATYKVTSAGSLVDFGQPLLRGSYAVTVWIAVDSLLWTRWERSKVYGDGQRFDESQDYADYNVPNVITRPPTK